MPNEHVPVEYDVVPVTSVTPHPRNVRHGDVGAITQSLAEFGQYRPIVVQRSTGHVLAGNRTSVLEAWKDWRVQQVECRCSQSAGGGVVKLHLSDLEYATAPWRPKRVARRHIKRLWKRGPKKHGWRLEEHHLGVWSAPGYRSIDPDGFRYGEPYDSKLRAMHTAVRHFIAEGGEFE